MSDWEAYHVQTAAMAKAFSQAAVRYDHNAVLQAEVGSRLLSRLPLLLADAPSCIADIGAGTGRLSAQLMTQYPDARVIALDIAWGMAQYAKQQYPNAQVICADTLHLPLPDNSVDLVFSNLALQWCHDIARVMQEWQRVLRRGGLVLFTTMGPDTLHELRSSWAAADAGVHVNAFYDMHDIGDALVRAGFVEPVLDVDDFTLTYSEVRVLLRELKSIGAHNVLHGRATHLMGKLRLKKMLAAYDSYRLDDGLIPASYEIIYGSAWKGNVSRQTAPGGVTRVPLDVLTQSMSQQEDR